MLVLNRANIACSSRGCLDRVFRCVGPLIDEKQNRLQWAAWVHGETTCDGEDDGMVRAISSCPPLHRRQAEKNAARWCRDGRGGDTMFVFSDFVSRQSQE